jgi:hypothetical protein
VDVRIDEGRGDDPAAGVEHALARHGRGVAGPQLLDQTPVEHQITERVLSGDPGAGPEEAADDLGPQLFGDPVPEGFGWPRLAHRNRRRGPSIGRL